MAELCVYNTIFLTFGTACAINPHMIPVTNVKFFNTDKEFSYAFPLLNSAQQDKLKSYLKPDWKLNISEPICLPEYVYHNISMISISDIKKLLGERVAEAFQRFMRGQTVMFIDGISLYEQDFCYSLDWNNFLHGGKLFFD